MFGLQKDFKYLESIFKIRNIFLLKKFFELFLFVAVNLLHVNSLCGEVLQLHGLRLRQTKLVKYALALDFIRFFYEEDNHVCDLFGVAG